MSWLVAVLVEFLGLCLSSVFVPLRLLQAIVVVSWTRAGEIAWEILDEGMKEDGDGQ